MTFGEVVREIPTVIGDLYENQVVKHFKVIAPTVLHVNVNLRCNTRCAMCNIWELKSPHALSLDQFEQIFTDPVYRRVEYLILAGGEPTLRKDLAEIVVLMHRYMPRLKKLMIASNVLNRASVQKQYPRIARYCADHRIRLSWGCPSMALAPPTIGCEGFPVPLTKSWTMSVSCRICKHKSPLA